MSSGNTNMVKESKYNNKVHTETPKFKQQYSNDNNNNVDPSTMADRRRSLYSIYNPTPSSVSNTNSKDSLPTDSHSISSNKNVTGTVEDTPPPPPQNESKIRKAPLLLRRTLSSLSMNSSSSNFLSSNDISNNRQDNNSLSNVRSDTASLPHNTFQQSQAHHHQNHILPQRKTSFAGNLFKRLSSGGLHTNKNKIKSKHNKNHANMDGTVNITNNNTNISHTGAVNKTGLESTSRRETDRDTDERKLSKASSKNSALSIHEALLEAIPHSHKNYDNRILGDRKSSLPLLPLTSSRRGSTVSGHEKFSGNKPEDKHYNIPSFVESREIPESTVELNENDDSNTAKNIDSTISNENDRNKEVAIDPLKKVPSEKLTFFPLDTNLDDLTDITKTAQTKSPSTEVINETTTSTASQSRQSKEGSTRASILSDVPRKSHSIADIPVWAASTSSSTSNSPFPSNKKSSQQWVAPESWDVDPDQEKIKAKSRARARSKRSKKHNDNNHHSGRKRIGRFEIEPDRTEKNVTGRTVNRLKNSLYMSPSGEENDTKLSDDSRFELESASTDTSSSYTSSDDEDFYDIDSDVHDNESDGEIAVSNRTISSVNLAISDKSRSNSAANIEDERYDKVEYELERYYKDFSDLDTKRHYAIRIFNIDDTFTTLSCTPGTTVEEMVPTLKKKFNITSQSNFQISLKVGKLSKILRPLSKPILVERKLLLLNGYRKSDPLHIIGIEDLSFVFKFVFHPVTPSHFTAEQEQRLLRSDFVHVDLRNMDLTTPPIIFYQHTSEIESLDVSNNANIFLPLEFIESAIKLLSLRMVNVRASKFPVNITEAYKLVSLELQRNFIKKVPSSISKLGNLTILNLQCNELDKLPNGFSQLKNLQLLDLSSNRFVHYPEVINQCTNLLQIDLSYNKIHRVPSSINQLVKLAKINLSHNKLTSINDLSEMKNLRTLNLRHNRVSIVKTNAPNLQNLFLTSNRISNFEENLPKLRALEIQGNPVTSISFSEFYPMNMTSLSLSKAQLASIPGELFTKLTRLEKLELSENNLSTLPSEIGGLTKLVYLSAARNKLESLPSEFSQLKSLRSLDLHSNNIRNFFDGVENIELTYLNISSNVFGGLNNNGDHYESVISGSKLSRSLLFFIAADNQFGDDMWQLFNCFTNLKLLNLSYNNFTDVSNFRLMSLTELYLSGNKLNSLPGDTVLKWKQLKTLMLNGNQLLSIPAEVSQLSQLTTFDIGSNQLKYNISNFHYDWNWRNNKEIKYLNFSGNRRFEIRSSLSHEVNADLSDLTVLPHLRILGLMDVTLNTSKVLDESSNFRLRTTPSIINGMRYGVADSLGQRDYVSTRDVTFERFRGNDNECLLCLHDSKNQSADYGHNISRIVRDIYDKILIRQLEKYGDDSDENIKRALRFSFLQLNKEINGMLSSVDNGADVENLSSADLLSGACSTIIYIKGEVMYAANLGDCTAILSKNNGDYLKLTREHVPSKREEYERIRISGGYVNNDRLDGVVNVSRAVGFFDLLPHIHASPDISVTTLTKADQMVVVATHKLWEYMDVETACDIARENSTQPLLAAEAMKDHAIAYGCSENITIMCLALYKNIEEQNKLTLNKSSLMTRRTTFEDSTLRRLQPEIDPPEGNVAVVFTDIKSSTLLWELFPNAMRTAMKTHNDLMRRQLRIFRGYEVKTEGDAFMVTFPTPTSALVWCLSVQLKLLDAQWPEEITSSQEGCLVTDAKGNKIYQGLSVRMGIHWGYPVTETDMVTDRMDYLGPVVNKASRVSGVADGGQITLSSDFVSEFKKIMKYHEIIVNEKKPLAEVYGDADIGKALENDIEMLESIGWEFFDYGEQKLKGLETKEFITIVYPKSLASRHEYAVEDDESNAIDEDILFRMRGISNKLESVLSAVSGGVIELDSHKLLGNEFVMLNTNARDAIMSAISEKETIMFLDHLVTRVESAVALLQLRQRINSGLEFCNSSNRAGPSSIFEILDKLLQDSETTKQGKITDIN